MGFLTSKTVTQLIVVHIVPNGKLYHFGMLISINAHDMDLACYVAVLKAIIVTQRTLSYNNFSLAGITQRKAGKGY